MAITSGAHNTSSKKSKSYHSNLDDLLLHKTGVVASPTLPSSIESPVIVATGHTLNLTYANPFTSTPSVKSPAIVNHAVIDNSDYNLNSLGGESLLLDAFYENLLRQNAARSLSNESGKQLDEEDEANWPRLHFDVTKLAAINSSIAVEIAAAERGGDDGGRCPTVTKKRIDSKSNNQPNNNQHNHVSSRATNGTVLEAKSNSKQHSTVDMGSVKDSQFPNNHKANNQNPLNRIYDKSSTVTNNIAKNIKMNGHLSNPKHNSPHINTRHKIVKPEASNLNFR